MDMETEAPEETPSTRHRILQIALTLMAQRGVDGTSMRDLASACGLNVASLYHYFPSKRELLEAVLVEHGFLPVRAGRHEAHEEGEDPLVALLIDILTSMFAVEDFVRLMVGEAMRAEETARSVGHELFATFETSISEWVRKHRPDLDERVGADAVARMLSGVVVGLFVLHAAGAMGTEGGDLGPVIAQRARETAQILGPGPAD